MDPPRRVDPARRVDPPRRVEKKHYVYMRIYPGKVLVIPTLTFVQLPSNTTDDIHPSPNPFIHYE